VLAVLILVSPTTSFADTVVIQQIDNVKIRLFEVTIHNLNLQRQLLNIEYMDYLESVLKNAGRENIDINQWKVSDDYKSLIYIDGTELDFVREGLNEGFKFNNPNVKDSCGCGESFTV